MSAIKICTDNSMKFGELLCSAKTLELLAPKCYDNNIEVLVDNRLKLGEVECSAETLAFLGYKRMPNDLEDSGNTLCCRRTFI